MEQRLKHLIKRLGGAIDQSLSQSDAISEVIGEIRKEGYDVLLVLEATIGFSKRQEESESDNSSVLTHEDLERNLTEQDQQFLRALSIKLDD